MKQLLLFSILLFSILTVKAQTIDLSKEIVGDWVFLYAEAKELTVNNESVRDSILADIDFNKILLAGQILSYGSDGTLKVISKDEVSEGIYTIEGNMETYTFDDFSFSDSFSIVGDTLHLDFGHTDYYSMQEYSLERDSVIIENAITRYIYLRKKD